MISLLFEYFQEETVLVFKEFTVKFLQSADLHELVVGVKIINYLNLNQQQFCFEGLYASFLAQIQGLLVRVTQLQSSSQTNFLICQILYTLATINRFEEVTDTSQDVFLLQYLSQYWNLFSLGEKNHLVEQVFNLNFCQKLYK